MSKLRLVLLSVALGFVASGATAATVTKMGDNVKFTFDDATLYGDGMVVGNSIFFLPTTFRAESLNGAGVDTASATLNIKVEAVTQDYVITDFALAEQGDYFLNGTGASVTASGRLQVSSNTKTCGIFPCLDNETFNVGGLTTQGATTDWTANASVDLADTAGWVWDTDVVAQIQNNLSATTLNGGEQAWIQKKAQLVGLTVTVVPIPAAAWLFMSALGAVFGFTRRRGAAA